MGGLHRPSAPLQVHQRPRHLLVGREHAEQVQPVVGVAHEVEPAGGEALRDVRPVEEGCEQDPDELAGVVGAGGSAGLVGRVAGREAPQQWHGDPQEGDDEGRQAQELAQGTGGAHEAGVAGREGGEDGHERRDGQIGRRVNRSEHHRREDVVVVEDGRAPRVQGERAVVYEEADVHGRSREAGEGVRAAAHEGVRARGHHVADERVQVLVREERHGRTQGQEDPAEVHRREEVRPEVHRLVGLAEEGEHGLPHGAVLAPVPIDDAQLPVAFVDLVGAPAAGHREVAGLLQAAGHVPRPRQHAEEGGPGVRDGLGRLRKGLEFDGEKMESCREGELVARNTPNWPRFLHWASERHSPAN